MKKLNLDEVKRLTNLLGPEISDYDFVYAPTLIEGREDIAICSKNSTDGKGDSIDTYFLMWQDRNDKMQINKLGEFRHANLKCRPKIENGKFDIVLLGDYFPRYGAKGSVTFNIALETLNLE